MKYLFRVIIVLLVAAGVVFGYSYYYREKKNNENIVLTTQIVSTTAEGETTASTKKLMLQNEDGDYKFYYDTKKEVATLEHDGFEKELDSYWSAILNYYPTTTYYDDFDDDGEKDLLVLFYSESTEIKKHLIAENKSYDFSGKYYRAALFKTVKTDNKITDISIVYADQNTWKNPFEQAVNSQMNQLKSCDKYLQLVMDNVGTELSYNEKTGLSQNKYVFFARAVKTDSNDGYKKFEKWSKGYGSYYIKNGEIKLSIMVFAYYEDTASRGQYVGDINTDITIDKNGKFAIEPGSINFTANDEYKISDPRNAADEKFSYTINNNNDAVATMNDNYINWLVGTFDVSQSTDEETISFGDMESQIKCVEKVVVTQSSITLTAKEGFIFSDRLITSGDYGVTVKSGDDEYDISYSASVSEKDARSVLKIKFDRKYSRSELSQLTVKYGG